MGYRTQISQTLDINNYRTLVLPVGLVRRPGLHQPVGEPLYPDTLTALMAKLINGYNRLVTPRPRRYYMPRLYDLRHLHATTLLLADVPVHLVAAQLGHADPVATLRIYSHVLREHATGVGDIFAQAVKASVSKSGSKPGQQR